MSGKKEIILPEGPKSHIKKAREQGHRAATVFCIRQRASIDSSTKCDVACGMVNRRQQWYRDGRRLSQSGSA